MAGPFGHMVGSDGQLLEVEEFVTAIDNLGHVYGMVKRCRGCSGIWPTGSLR